MIELGQWDKAKDIYEDTFTKRRRSLHNSTIGFLSHIEHITLTKHFDTINVHFTFLLINYRQTILVWPLYIRTSAVFSQTKAISKKLIKNFNMLWNLKAMWRVQIKKNIVNSLNVISMFSLSFFVFKAKIRNNIATLLEKQGRPREAIENVEYTLKVLCECLPPTHPEIAASYSNIATLYYQIEDYSNALISYEKCHDIQEASLPAHHPDLNRTKLYMRRTMAIIQQRDRGSRHVRKIFHLVCCQLCQMYGKTMKFFILDEYRTDTANTRILTSYRIFYSE